MRHQQLELILQLTVHSESLRRDFRSCSSSVQPLLSRERVYSTCEHTANNAEDSSSISTCSTSRRDERKGHLTPPTIQIVVASAVYLLTTLKIIAPVFQTRQLLLKTLTQFSQAYRDYQNLQHNLPLNR